MKRIYHTWEKWECFPAGLYEQKPPGDMTAKQANEAYAGFLRDIPLFEKSLERVIMEWPRSCEHYLSNEKMNRVAWLGQASVCIHLGIPQGYRGGFNLLSPEEQSLANQAALKWLNVWLERQGEPQATMEQAGIAAEVNLY
jgi:hypothetical protein